MISLTVGITLLIVKYTAYFITQSAAVFSDATESIANVLASGVALYSLVVAHRPADAEHPYGHGKVEFISAWFEASMIMGAAVFIIIKTIDALSHGEIARQESAMAGIILMSAAMVVNGVVGLYLIRTGRRQGSMTLVADGKHLLTDVWTSIGVLIALGLVKWTGWALFDPIAAFLVAGYIAWSSAKMLRHAAAGIMDKQDIEDERVITQILDSHCGAAGREPRICNYHKLRHRHSGRYHWVDFHIRLPETVTVRRAHEVASSIEEEIEAAVGEGNATAHVEPCDRSVCVPPGNCNLVTTYVPLPQGSGALLTAPPEQPA
jgi:cation diffusion facilitator family transporter